MAASAVAGADRRERSRRQHVFDTIALGIGLLALWEVLGRTGVVPQQYIPPITAIVPDVAVRLAEPTFWVAMGHTVAVWAISLLIVGLAGTALGLLIGASGTLDRATRSSSSSYARFRRWR
ncbi:MAG: hypothetical protein J2P20_01225 [Pseudonocardia sp.]|nr:hypothetical protein [Pseudonocardia sp.]